MAGSGPRILFAVHAVAARRDARLSDPAFRTLCAIAEYANTDGVAWPSLETLAKARGITRRNVQKHLRELEDRGHLQTIRGKQHGHNTYVLLFGRRRRPARVPPDDGPWRQTELFTALDAGVSPRDTSAPTRGVAGRHLGGVAGRHPNNTIEQLREAAVAMRNGGDCGNGTDPVSVSDVLARLNGSPLERALARLGGAVIERKARNGQGGKGLEHEHGHQLGK